VHNKGMAQKVAANLQAVKEKHLAGKVAEAEAGYRELLKRHPGLNEVLHPLGIALQQQGKHAEAVDYIQRWVKVAPKDCDAQINLGNSLLNLGRGAEAANAYAVALAIRPTAPDVLLLKAMAEQQAGNMQQAEQSARRMLAIHPASPEGLFTLGTILSALGRTDESIQVYREALRHRPTMVEPMVNLASLLQSRQQKEEAISLYKEVLRLQPGMPEALLNLSTLEYEDGADPEQTRQRFLQVLERLPDHGETLNNLANVHMNLNQLDEAETYVRRRLAIPPESSSAHGTAAALFMLDGQWEEGWQHFEWRWLRDGLPVPLRDFGKPEWRGEDISGKTILIHHEQGLGDSIQFVRFVQQVQERAGQVILEVPANLLALYGQSIQGVTLATYDEPLPSFDVHIAMMSLPLVLGVTVDKVPAPIPYLHADPARVEKWRDRIPQGGLRIGIVWQGKPGTGVDKGRSYTLDQLAPVARVPGVTLISLQKGYGLDQLDRMPDGMKVETLGPDFDEGPGAFLDTAAVMQHLDLIISSDTSVAHLAGALGCPVWVPLKFSPDWRWMVERADSPWYPQTMRLFRQSTPGDWAGVFERLAAEVTALKDGDRTRLQAAPAPPRRPLKPFPPVATPPLPSPMPPAKLIAGPAPSSSNGETRWEFIASRPVSDGIMETDTLYGRMRYPANDKFIGHSLDLYGEWAAEEAELCMGLLREGDVVVEAGANIGSITLALARAVGRTGQVHSFEPQRFIHDLLSWNVQTNDLPQVRIHHAAVGASMGAIQVPPIDYARTESFGGISLIGAKTGEEVPLLTIDSLGLQNLRMLKADFEDMGYDVIKGAQETIARCRPILYVERPTGDRARALVDLIYSFGYRVWLHRTPFSRENNFRHNHNALSQHVVSSNFLCVPAESRPVVIGLSLVDPPGAIL